MLKINQNKYSLKLKRKKCNLNKIIECIFWILNIEQYKYISLELQLKNCKTTIYVFYLHISKGILLA